MLKYIDREEIGISTQAETKRGCEVVTLQDWDVITHISIQRILCTSRTNLKASETRRSSASVQPPNIGGALPRHFGT